MANNVFVFLASYSCQWEATTRAKHLRTCDQKAPVRFPHGSCTVSVCISGGFSPGFRGVSAAFLNAFPPVSARFRPFPCSFQTFSTFTHIWHRVRKLHKIQRNLHIPVHKLPLHKRFRPQPNPPFIILKGVLGILRGRRAPISITGAPYHPECCQSRILTGARFVNSFAEACHVALVNLNMLTSACFELWRL